MPMSAAEREIDKIKTRLAAATAAQERARRAKDTDAMAVAVAELMRCRRKAGALLAVGLSPEVFEISEVTAEHWAALAALTDEQFESQVQRQCR